MTASKPTECIGDENCSLELAADEVQTLNSQLDALNSALDNIESKNDNLASQLKEILEANRQMRLQVDSEKLNPSQEDVNSSK